MINILATYNETTISPTVAIVLGVLALLALALLAISVIKSLIEDKEEWISYTVLLLLISASVILIFCFMLGIALT